MRHLRKLFNIIETKIKGRKKLRKTDTAEMRKKPEKKPQKTPRKLRH